MSNEQKEKPCISGDRESLGAMLSEHKAGYARKLYKTPSGAHKTAELQRSVAEKTNFLYESSKRRPVDFNDIEDVKTRTREYLDACAETGSFPSLMGLAAYGFGMSRRTLYWHLKNHPETESSRFIDRVRDLIADVLASAALNRHADSVVSIFVLKNGLGFSDRVEIEPVAPHAEENALSEEDLFKRYVIEER